MLDLTKLRSYPSTDEAVYALRETALRFRAGTFFDNPTEAAILADNISGAILSASLGSPKPLAGASGPQEMLDAEGFAKCCDDLASAKEAEANASEEGAGETKVSGVAVEAEKPKGVLLNLALQFFLANILPLLIDRLKN